MRERSGFEKLDVDRLAEELADSGWRCVRKWDLLARRCVRIAVGSLYETKHWLRRAFQRELLAVDEIEQIRPTLEKLLPLLNGYLRSIGRDRLCPTHDLRPTTHE